MLTQLHIRDLAIVSALSLELRPGLTVLTGETGAGKSILIDALGLALGGRADNSMIRAGSERAEVTAGFDLRTQPRTQAWLESQALDEGEDECLVRRVLSREGRSRAYINGRPVALQQVQTLGGLLVEIHGQHAHQSLLKRQRQRQLLDAYGGHQPLAGRVVASFKRYRASRDQLEGLSAAAADRASRLDLLRFQAGELSEHALSPQQLEALEQEHRRLSHLDQLRQGCAEVLNQLDENEPSGRGLLVGCSELLSGLEALDEGLTEPREMLDNALIQVDETLTFLRNHLSGLELDPSGIQELGQQLQGLHDLARKYRVPAAELPQRLEAIQRELGELERADITLADLQAQVEQEWSDYLQLAGQLSECRAQAASRLNREISEAMQQLAMPGGVFQAELRPLEQGQATAEGLEQVEFMVSANPGMPLQPLNKVASGGELSRISLAIQVATIRYGQTPTLIFDEVDVGIGGGTAEIVGQMLRQLGGSRQILCVTHLPQVAAQAEHHLRVQKHTRGEQTRTGIEALDEAARIQEIARMLGGVEITPQTLAHASEMVRLALAGA